KRWTQAQLFGIERNDIPGAASIERGGDCTSLLHQGEAQQSDGRGADNDRGAGEPLWRSAGAGASFLTEELQDRLVYRSPRRVKVRQSRRIIPDLASPGRAIDRLSVRIASRFEEIVGMVQFTQWNRWIVGQRAGLKASKQNAVRVLIPFVRYHL